MKKLLAVVLVALLSVGAFAAVNLAGSLSVTTSLSYDASAATLNWSVTPSAYWTASASGSDGVTGFTVSFGSNFNVESGYVWYKPYITDPLTVELRAGRLARSISIFGTTVLNGDTANGLGAGFTMKAGDLSDVLWVYVDPASSPTYVEADVVNTLTFGALTVRALLNDIVAGTQTASAELGLTVSADAAKLLNIEGASLTIGGGFSGTFPSNPLGMWIVGASFGIDKFSGMVYFNSANMIHAEVETTLLAPVTVGAYFETDATDPFGSLGLGAWASWTLGVLSNTISLDYAAPSVEVSWKVSASF